jgi:hypothetical protein
MGPSALAVTGTSMYVTRVATAWPSSTRSCGSARAICKMPRPVPRPRSAHTHPSTINLLVDKGDGGAI